MENSKNITIPLRPHRLQSAPRAGLSHLLISGDKMGTRKNIDYTSVKFYDGKKSFFYFGFKRPYNNTFKRFKVYGRINRIKDPEERKEYIQAGIDDLSLALKNGFNPFAQDVNLIVIKNWTVVQGFNFFKQNLSNRGLRPRTIAQYQSVLRFLYDYFPMQTPINEVTKIQVNAIFRQAKEKKKWSNVTFNNQVTVTKAIWNYLIEEEVTDHNPVKVKPLPESITKHRYFSDEIFEKIKENAPEDLLRFIMFLYHTGTRPNEARQLKYDHIDPQRKVLKIPAFISKNKKDDYVPLTDYIINNFTGEGFIFGTKVNYFGKRFRKLKKDLKLPKDYTLYSIKATRAIHLAQDNADPYTIMQLFRHSDLGITKSYLRDLGVNINREAVEKGIKF